MRSLLSIFILAFILTTTNLLSQTSETIKLPPPQKEIGKPLMQVLNLRQSTRVFELTPLPQQEISNLLWAAFGINRAESGKRTAPSARNWQEIEIFISTADGVFLYDAKDHSLKTITKSDIRAVGTTQDFAKTAPMNIIYVADQSKMGNATKEDKSMYSGVDVGFIAQNVYLYCASQGLGTVIRGAINREAIAEVLNLDVNKKVMFSQTVGYIKK